MADASLVVRIRSVGERKLKEIRRDLDRISASAATAGASLKAFARGYNDAWDKHLKNVKKNFTRHFDDLDRMVKMTGGALLKGLGLAIKATGAEFALMGASMIAVHGLFAAGNVIMKAYHATMTALTGVAAAAAVALASVAAALREQNAAMFAYKANGYNQFGNNLNRVRVVMRGLETDSRMATVGVENLNAAYAAVSKRSTFNRGSQALLRGLMDFASAGQPLDQGVKAAGELIGVLQDPKASFSEISKAAEALGPSMKKAMEEAKKSGIDTAEELKKAINDGTLVAMGGVEGQFDAVNSTLMSVLKGGFNQIRSMFADMGQPFLKPLKEAADEIIIIFKRTFMRVSGQLNQFGKGSFINGLVGFAEKFEELFVKLIRDYLPRVDGIMGRIGDKWESFTRGWNRILDALRPLIDGARVLERTLKAIFGPVWDRIKEKFGDFNKQLQENEPALIAFGDAIGAMLVSFSEITDKVRDLFFQALPFLTKIVQGITQVANVLNGVFGTMANMFGGSGDGFGAFGLLMGLGILGRGMKNTKGGFVQKPVQSMSVNANNVYLTGATAGGQMYPGAGIPMGAGMSPYGPGGVMGPAYAGAPGGGFRSMRSQGPSSAYYPPGSIGGGQITHAQGRQMGMSSAQVAAYNRATTAQARSAPMTASGMRGLPSRLQQWSGSRGFRAMRNNSLAYGQFERFNSSSSARMGSMAALGMLGSFMPEETQGAMALGSTLAAINPALGIGVAGLGTAMTSNNTAVGLLGGAGGGAALGMQIAGPWGALAGGIIGGIVGGIKVGFNKNKAKKEEARKVAKAAAESMLDGMMEGISTIGEGKSFKKISSTDLRSTLKMDEMRKTINASYNAVQDAVSHETRQRLVQTMFDNQSAYGISMTQDELDKALEKPKEFLQTLNTELNPTFTASTILVNKFEDRMEIFKRTLNMTEEEVMRLAQATGTNLYDATKTATEMLGQLSEGMIRNKETFDYAMADLGAGVLTSLGIVQKREEAPLIMDEAAQALLDASRAGDFSAGMVAEQVQAIFGGLVDVYEGDTTRAMLTFMQEFGSGASFAPGRTLAGLTLEDQKTFMDAIGPALTEIETFFNDSDPIGEMIRNAFGDMGWVADIANFGEAGINILENPQRFMEFMDQFSAENLEEMGMEGLRDLINTQFPSLGLSLEEFTGTAADLATDLDTLTDNVSTALTELVTALGNAARDINPPASDPPDTRTPRGDTLSSRYSRTMSAHAQLDSMTRGKRFMTSGWRNFNLGSPSSDHVMGRAYDLTGQNLGAYKSLVDATGGFAEFHGAAGGRHLHVVPNTSGGPTGDSSSPAAVGIGAAGGMTNYNNYTININGSDQSPEQIAEAVMTRIKRDEMSNRERY